MSSAGRDKQKKVRIRMSAEERIEGGGDGGGAAGDGGGGDGGGGESGGGGGGGGDGKGKTLQDMTPQEREDAIKRKQDGVPFLQQLVDEGELGRGHCACVCKLFFYCCANSHYVAVLLCHCVMTTGIRFSVL